MLSKRREHREALRNLLPLIETQKNNLELRKSLNEYEDYMERITQQNDQLDEYAQKTGDLEQHFENQKTEIENYKMQLIEKERLIYECQSQNKSQVEDQKMEIENYKKQLKKITEEKKELINQLQENVAEKEKIIENQEKELHEYVRKSDYYGRKIDEQTRKIEEYEQKLKKMAREKGKQIEKQVFNPISYSKSDFHLFLEDKNFEIIKNSTVVMDSMANRLFKREEGDNDKREPPLKEINPQERRRREVFEFMDFIRINWNNPGSGTVIQKNIHFWLDYNWHQFLYEPSREEKEKSRKLFLNKFKLENTIGTIHFLTIHFRDRSRYLCFAISNYRIVYWNYHDAQQKAYYDLYDNLKGHRKWTGNSKFATEMEVNLKQSDTFIHTSNKDVSVENEKVVTWIKNNFNLKQQYNQYEHGFHNIPSLYNFFFNFYDTSLTR